MKRRLIIFAIAVACNFSLFAQAAGKGVSFDLGTEPELTGNVSYGMIQYGWTDNTSSRLDIRYTTETEAEYATATDTSVKDRIEGYNTIIYSANKRAFEANLLPFVRYFGMNDRGQGFSWSIGLSFQYIYESEFAGMFDVNGIMLEPGDEGKYFTMNDEKSAFVIAPRIGFSGKIPLPSLFQLNFEFFLHPLYYMNLKQSMAYYSQQTNPHFDYSGNNDKNRVSSPYISLKLSLDMFNNFRLMTLCTYQHLDFQQMDWAEDFNSLIGYDDKQDIFTFRFGLEFLSGNAKSTRIRSGVYYQIETNKSSYLDSVTKNNRWVINLGTEM